MLCLGSIPTFGVSFYIWYIETYVWPGPEHPDGGTYTFAWIFVTRGLVSLALSVSVNRIET